MLYLEIGYQHFLLKVYTFLFMSGIMDTAEEMFFTKMKIQSLEVTFEKMEDDF